MDTSHTLPASPTTLQTYLIDVTFCLTAAGPEWSPALWDRIHAVMANPLAKKEQWWRCGKEYVRVVFPFEARNFPEVLVYLGEASRKFTDAPQGMTVQLAARNITYHATDGIPPNLKRSRGGASR